MKQLQKHLIIILVMGIMLAAALIGGISTFTFREISSNDNRAIMKRRIRNKNIDQQSARNIGIKLDTGFDIVFKAGIHLNRDQSTDSAL